jgi:hypothetical protein
MRIKGRLIIDEYVPGEPVAHRWPLRFKITGEDLDHEFMIDRHIPAGGQAVFGIDIEVLTPAPDAVPPGGLAPTDFPPRLGVSSVGGIKPASLTDALVGTLMKVTPLPDPAVITEAIAAIAKPTRVKPRRRR